MAVQTASGSKLAIGPANNTAVSEGEFVALQYIVVGEIEDMGEFGDTANEITFTALDNRRVRKFKGSFNAGTMNMTLGRDPADDGQSELVDAMASDEDFAFRVTLNDAIGEGGDPTTFYFRGKVMSYTANIGNAENIVRSSVAIGINSAVVEVGPDPAS